MVDRTEEEQIQAIKDWWKKNGFSTVLMVVLVLGAYFAGQYYQGYQTGRLENATGEYSKLLDYLAAEDKTKAKEQAKRLQTAFDGTTQAVNAALVVAAVYVEDAEYDQAAAALRYAKEKANLASLTQLATVRLARVLYQKGDLDEALSVLGTTAGSEYLALVEEVKGDIYVAKGDVEQARAAYSRSMEANPGRRLNFIQMKLDDLPQKPANAG